MTQGRLEIGAVTGALVGETTTAKRLRDDGHERDRAHARTCFEKERVEVDVRIERAAEALDQRHRTAVAQLAGTAGFLDEVSGKLPGRLGPCSPLAKQRRRTTRPGMRRRKPNARSLSSTTREKSRAAPQNDQALRDFTRPDSGGGKAGEPLSSPDAFEQRCYY